MKGRSRPKDSRTNYDVSVERPQDNPRDRPLKININMNGNDLVQGNRNDAGALQGYHGTSNTAGTQDSIENQPRIMQQQNMPLSNGMIPPIVQPNNFIMHPNDAQ